MLSGERVQALDDDVDARPRWGRGRITRDGRGGQRAAKSAVMFVAK